jgi:hypothetical protein
MRQDFLYPLPDELYVNSFNLDRQFSNTYEGPEKINVLVNKLTGELCGIDPETYNEDCYDIFEVDASLSPEISYYIYNSSQDYEYQYEEEMLENGDTYKKVLNPKLQDAYTISYDYFENVFKLNLIVKTLENNLIVDHLIYVKNKFNYILSHEEGKKEKGEDPGVSNTLLETISQFILKIDDEIKNNLMIMEWKYINYDTLFEYILPVPEELKNLLNTYQ